MIDKKEFLLQSIIKAYIEHLEPIGSKELKSMYELDYSPATIRGYFKKLGNEGLKQYWIGKLNFSISGVNIKAIEFLANKIGVTVFLKKEKSDILQNIINVENRYIILEFTTFVVNIKFNPALYKFLSDFLQSSLKDILKISKDVGAYELYSSINYTLQSSDFDIFNYKEFLSLALNFDEFT